MRQSGRPPPRSGIARHFRLRKPARESSKRRKSHALITLPPPNRPLAVFRHPGDRVDCRDSQRGLQRPPAVHLPQTTLNRDEP